MRTLRPAPALALLVLLFGTWSLLGLDHVLTHTTPHPSATCPGDEDPHRAPDDPGSASSDNHAGCLLCALPHLLAASMPLTITLAAPSASTIAPDAGILLLRGLRPTVHRSRGPPTLSL
jgi:hypothetical protein